MTLVLALLLDALLGEPRAIWDRWPHPAVLMGRAVAWADRTFNDGNRLKGVLALALLLAGAIALGQLLAALPGQIVEVLVGAILLAQRSLADHVSAVARALRPLQSAGARDAFVHSLRAVVDARGQRMPARVVYPPFVSRRRPA